jgi:uncharacterized damage-inducible protein DinB
MSRQDDAARELEELSLELTAVIAGCSDTAWRRVSGAEGWTVAALAYHCALGNDVATGWICQMLARRPVYETSDSHDVANAADAMRYEQATKAEATDALRRTTARTAHFLRSLSDEELDRSSFHGVAAREMSVAQFIGNFGRHIRLHLASLREATAA